MPYESLANTLGIFGLFLGVLGHLAYQVYRDRRGAVNDLREGMKDAHERLDGVGVVLYRQAREEWEEVDERQIRDLLFNGHEVTFPDDFEYEDYHPLQTEDPDE